MLLTIVLTFLTTIITLILLLNFTPAEKKIETKIEHLYSVRDPSFLRSVGNLLGPPTVAGNEVTVLKNGDEIFPAMLEAISQAQKTICFETYIYWSGDTGRTFAKSLAEKSREGIKVHVILDWSGSLKMEDELLAILEDAKVNVVKYHPIRWYTISRFNNRTHRKLLVVDGSVGFIGGVGIADQWKGNAESPEHWRDTHFRLRGPAAAQMQAAFMDNWTKTNSQVLHGDAYLPELSSKGEVVAQVFKSSSDEGSESARLLFLLSIASAQENIRISASYFVPDKLSITTLIEARKRGVEIDIILPGPFIDAKNVRHASRNTWGPLLREGVRIFEFQPTMYHCKIMIIDDLWSTVGSTNFDNRSFRINDEANLNIHNYEFARLLTEHFEEDKRRASAVSLKDWESRPLLEKLQGTFWGLFRTQL